jgi:hypothetical protein
LLLLVGAVVVKKPFHSMTLSYTSNYINAEVVTFVAGSLEAGGLPGYPEVLVSLK